MNVLAIPDYISPIVGYRVWEWGANKLWSLNGEAWLPDRALTAKCRSAELRSLNAAQWIPSRALPANCPTPDHGPPADGCSCGVYAAKNYQHLQKIIHGVEYGLHGEVYLWGKVVEHDLGYRSQFAYPKSLVLPSNINPRLESFRLESLMVYGADISLPPNILLWTKGSGYTPAGSDLLMGRGKPCGKWCKQWHERTLQMGDCVTVLGQGIGLVERDDGSPGDTVCIRLRNDYVFIVPQQGIVWNCQNWRWEVDRWDQDLSGYRDKGCPLLIRRKSESSNGRGSNKTPLLPDPVIPRTSTPPKSRGELVTARPRLHKSSSPGGCASTVNSAPEDDDLDARLRKYWEQWAQKGHTAASIHQPKSV